ncbi:MULTISPECIES: EamA family transporter RarD [unclassified Cryobacterium]|uniref:EamA family transporter RarD n=1 Tax=unclassified Cryobacterium TaxID=2649013 RepID=UPI002AB3A224|nr:MULTISPECIES: EamA family transporter RarD [unclassified Cryobacterium]MDY7529058.1 EamA family transporter RarD [Cryobacterium sp. 10C2]MDY7558773.1 EamA family transporter RarD [Cryobacterium sp. 10C3]MEB0202797.1 EamA family transporter RarD [Cryobacterium sp. 5I3]MEB0291055.1 EamA family transporter RarD [Cryobacterium sp. 10C2]
MSRTRSQSAEPTSGLAFATSAYGLWGLLPLFFLLLHPTGPFEVVAWRVLFSLVFCLALITVTRGWPALLTVLRRPKTVWVMGLAGLLIFVNWQTYVFATLTGHVVEAALGYFMNPIVTVLLGVFVLHERLRRIQWIAVAISAAAVLVLTLGYGALPWISLVLALSFGFYGLIKKNVGPGVGALTGLTLETAWLMPIAVAELLIVGAVTGLTFGTVSPWHTVGLVSTGVVTAVPLLFFAAAARRLPLSLLGLVQFVAPVLQFLVGVFILGEPMPPERWVGFGLVWVALVILTADMVVTGRAPRRASPEPL